MTSYVPQTKGRTHKPQPPTMQRSADHQRELQQRAGTSNAFADLAAQTMGYVKASGEAAEHRMILDNCGCLFDRLSLSESSTRTII